MTVIDRAIQKIAPEIRYNIIDDQIVWLDDDNIPSEDEINDAVALVKEEDMIEYYLYLLDDICDKTSQSAKRFIAGKEISVEQMERYESKYLTAKKYKEDGSYEDFFKLESDLTGNSVDDLTTEIIELGDAYNYNLMWFNSMIEAFRIKTKSIILSKDYDRVNVIFGRAILLGGTSTPDDVKALFDE